MKYLMFLTSLLMFSSCTYNSEEELGAFDIPPGNIPIEEHEISFQTTVRPIIDIKCAISGCHEAGTTDKPDFSIDGNVEANAQKIKTEVLSGRMPLVGSLSFQEIDSLVSWVNQGAQLD